MTAKVSLVSKINIAIKLLGFIFLILFPTPVAHAASSITKPVRITASIGQLTSITIYGYTAPLAKTELTAPSIYAKTYSQTNGYFEFSQIYLPENPQDLCLSSVDSNQLPSPPVCIPAPKSFLPGQKIGPVILPPTIVLSNSQPLPGELIQIQGQSIPNTELNLKLYQQNKNPLQFPAIAWAYELPQISFKTDSKGNYSLNLPSVYSTSYRLNTQANYQPDQPSPQSFTLTYSLPAYWLIMLKQYLSPLISFILTLCTLLILVAINSSKPTRYLPYLYAKQLILPPHEN